MSEYTYRQEYLSHIRPPETKEQRESARNTLISFHPVTRWAGSKSVVEVFDDTPKGTKESYELAREFNGLRGEDLARTELVGFVPGTLQDDEEYDTRDGHFKHGPNGNDGYHGTKRRKS
jgi:hypothetical protein